MTVALQKIIEEVNDLNDDHFLALEAALKKRRPTLSSQRQEQAGLLAEIHRRRHFQPADYGLPDSVLLLREDRGAACRFSRSFWLWLKPMV